MVKAWDQESFERDIKRLQNIIAEFVIGIPFEELYGTKNDWLLDKGKKHSLEVPFKVDVTDAAYVIYKTFLYKNNDLET